MEGKIFLGKKIYHTFEANEVIGKFEKVVVNCIEEFFPGRVDKDEYTQSVASGPVNDFLIFKLEATIEDPVDSEITHADSFNPALTIAQEFCRVLEEYIGYVAESLTLIVTVKLDLVRKNRVFDPLRYKGKVHYEKGVTTIMRENTEASSE